VHSAALYGREIKASDLERGNTALEINALDLVSGLHFMVVDGVCLKVVVLH